MEAQSPSNFDLPFYRGNPMPTFADAMQTYRQLLQQGDIQVAYKGLMDYMLALRGHFQSRYPEFNPGSLYFGYMDMTYFALTPPALKARQLKIAVVFLHEAFRFEVWLAAANKAVQTRAWQQIQSAGWDAYRLVPTPQGYDSILETVAATDPDFNDLPALTTQIERVTLQMVADVEAFFAAHSG
jgi:hypothetical protein